jgi:hypothetical protein
MLVHIMAERSSPGTSIFQMLGKAPRQEPFGLFIPVHHERYVSADLGIPAPKEVSMIAAETQQFCFFSFEPYVSLVERVR